MFELVGKYTSAKVYADICETEAQAQIVQLCNHPAFEKAKICVMPDVHAGAGCTIGTTIQNTNDCIVPNIVGVDIGCGVLTSIFPAHEIDFEALNQFIAENIPSGFSVRSSPAPYREVADIEKRLKPFCQSHGFVDKYDRYLCSIGTLGGGNHYIEVGKTSDDKYALSIHTGSRNLGKMTCDYYQSLAKVELAEIKKQDKQYHHITDDLAFVRGELTRDYLNAMTVCQTFACVNRQIILKELLNYLGVSQEIHHFDTIHNYVEATPSGYIIRKGAVAAYANHTLAIPLNMRDGVLLCVGKGNVNWNYSAPHGAGRIMSRSKAKEVVTLDEFIESMDGIQTWSVCSSTIDESPQAYKPAASIIDAIGDTVEIIDIIKPLYNYKAH